MLDIDRKIPSPGSLINRFAAPLGSQPYTVIAVSYHRHPGNWEQFDFLLLNDNVLTNVNLSRTGFFNQWDVILYA